MLTLADKGYQGAEGPVATPYKGRNKPPSQKAANRSHARLRGPGERANAQLKAGASSASFAAARTRQDSYARRSPSCRTTSSPTDEKSSVITCLWVTLQTICHGHRTFAELMPPIRWQDFRLGHRLLHGTARIYRDERREVCHLLLRLRMGYQGFC